MFREEKSIPEVLSPPESVTITELKAVKFTEAEYVVRFTPPLPKIDPAFKAKLVAWLRANPERQTQGRLIADARDGYFSSARYNYCAVGAAYHVDGVPDRILWFRGAEVTSGHLIRHGLTREHTNRLVTLNDGLEMTFAQIADYIESEW
jgi:hypothetical protein